ncbi:MAG: hypothetical protein JXA92_02185 [candidate division Zixibacteria bacterium]|nr:hypothetical protein [candidate division Zixibacteria bacterium]
MVDYTTNTGNLFMTASFIPMYKLRLSGTLAYNKSTTELDKVVMPDISDRLDGNLEHQDYSFDQMHEYSNLDYELWTISIGAQFDVSPGVQLTADAEYADLNDALGYVYGNESGSMFFIRTGVRFSF